MPPPLVSSYSKTDPWGRRRLFSSIISSYDSGGKKSCLKEYINGFQGPMSKTAKPPLGWGVMQTDKDSYLKYQTKKKTYR